MAWTLSGTVVVACNCDYGCPCQFNSLPTHGDCRAAAGYEFEEGHFGDVKLDGLRAVMTMSWPKAIHEGNGTLQLIIDERATPAQRDAIGKIMTGQETQQMATMWWVFSAMSPNKLPTLYKPIDFEVDVDARRGRFGVPGLLETTGEPIRNPVTGDEHRVRIDLPNGFEYRLAEIGSASTQATGEIKLGLERSYGQFARIHLSHAGVVA
jgi:hypothetical protein